MHNTGEVPGSSHAIVIGASIAGLLAARVLADHVDRVTIIERDHLPETPQFRAGVPQSRHLHGLLERGRLLLEQLFPGLGADLAAAGALTVTTADFLWLTPAGWMRRFRPGIPLLLCSRELLEWSVRRHVAAMGRVCIRQDCDVTGLLPNQERTAVVGVQLHTRTRGSVATAGTEDVRADLVVDASGQHSRAPRWLEALGYPPPQETVINAFLGYASRYYARPSGAGADWKMLALFPKPPGLGRLGVLAPIEGDRWLVTLGGYGRDYPPTDEAGFLAFARSLRSPLLYEAIKDAQPLSSIAGYQRTANRLHRYDRLPRQPERFLVLGDAVCAFNPVYGQGMTVAALAALVLDRCLREQRRGQPAGDMAGLARHFQQQLARSNAPAWLMATGEDLRYPTTEGARPDLPTRLMHRYVDRVIRVSTQNQTVNRTFFNAMHMLTPPAAMFQPAVLLPTLLAGGRPGLAEPPLEVAHGCVRAVRAAAPLVS